jgi:hypothetical protein
MITYLLLVSLSPKLRTKTDKGKLRKKGAAAAAAGAGEKKKKATFIVRILL